MTNLEILFNEIEKEKRRISILKNTKEIDVDFMRSEIKKAHIKIAVKKEEFNNEYDLNN